MWQEMTPANRRKTGIVLAMTFNYGFVLGAQFYVARLVSLLGGSATVAGLLLVLSVLPVFGIALLGKRLTQGRAPAQILRVGMASHALQLLMLALAPDIFWLAPAMILGGIGYACCFAPLLNLTTALVPPAHYAQGIAYMSLSSQLGIGMGSLVAAAMEPWLGTHGVFWGPFVLALLGLTLSTRLPVPAASAAESPAGNPAIAENTTPDAGGGRTTPASPRPPVPGMAEIFLLMGVLGLAFGLPLQYVPMWLAQSREMGFSPAYFLSTSFFTIMTTRLLFSHLLSGAHEFRVVTCCFVLISLAIAVLGLAHTPLQFVLCAAFYGASYSLLYPSCTAYLLKPASVEARNALSVWVLLAYEIGARCLPIGFGMIADHGGFPQMFLLLSVVVAAVASWHIAKRRKIQRLIFA